MFTFPDSGLTNLGRAVQSRLIVRDPKTTEIGAVHDCRDVCVDQVASANYNIEEPKPLAAPQRSQRKQTRARLGEALYC